VTYKFKVGYIVKINKNNNLALCLAAWLGFKSDFMTVALPASDHCRAASSTRVVPINISLRTLLGYATCLDRYENSLTM
jgi:hypothetical protein